MTGQSVAGAYAKIEAHEDVCAVRYGNIRQSQDVMAADIQRLYGLAWKAAMAVVGLLITVVLGLIAVIYVVQVDRPHQAPPVAIVNGRVS